MSMNPFLAAAYGSISDIEVAWVLIALVGFGYSVWNYREAFKDFKWVNNNSIGNGRKILAKISLLAEGIRAVIQLIFVIIGILAMFVPDPPDNLNLPTAQLVIRIMITWGLIISSLLLTIKSYLGKKARDLIT